jgi:hypothetical protein
MPGRAIHKYEQPILERTAFEHPYERRAIVLSDLNLTIDPGLLYAPLFSGRKSKIVNFERKLSHWGSDSKNRRSSATAGLLRDRPPATPSRTPATGDFEGY